MLRFALALGAVAALSGCTVPVVGATGSGVDASGQPVGYLAVCQEHIDGASLYFDDPSKPIEQRSIDVGEWTADPPVTSLASWAMNDDDERWTSTGPLPALKPGRPYVMYGWTKDNSSSTTDIILTVEQLQTLEPGKVLYFGGFDEKTQRDRYTTGTPEQFQAEACKG